MVNSVATITEGQQNHFGIGKNDVHIAMLDALPPSGGTPIRRHFAEQR